MSLSLDVKYFIPLFLILTIASLFSTSIEEIKSLHSNVEKEIKVDLRSPVFVEGVLSTSEGGVITGPNLRIQARHIIYTRKATKEGLIFQVTAKGDVALDWGENFFIGESLEYNFLTKTGKIYEARSAVEPWYFGGRAIELYADGSYLIHEGFVTTSENYYTDWQVTTAKARLREKHLFDAKNIQFHFVHFPILCLPSFKANLNAMFDNPLRFNVTWRGGQNTRLEMQYKLFSWGSLKNFLRLDYRIKRGLGGGFYTLYHSENNQEKLEMINYIARDSSVDQPSQRTRYRFQGAYTKICDRKGVSIHTTWDKLSDIDMATDYMDKNLDIETAGKTQLQVKFQQSDAWKANFFARIRANTFQTVKQELPSLEISIRPFSLGSTGIISENFWRLSYLDFQYAKHSQHVYNFNSTRAQFYHKLYRSYRTGPFTTTPEVGASAIYYGSNPHAPNHWVTLGMFSVETNTQLRRHYSGFKHVIKPYVKYKYYTRPGIKPNKHYIFDIQDGWYQLNMLTWGVDHSFYYARQEKGLDLWMRWQLFAHTFINTPTIKRATPKIYSRLTWNLLPTLRHTFTAGWDMQRHQWDHFNFRNEWTINRQAALSLEWRHRGSFAWRKADQWNFILDSFHSEKKLKGSQLSDRRDTLLIHLFYRWHPNWAVEFESRHGWNRRHEPNYSEYEIDILATVQKAWNIKLSYQRKEYDKKDNRIALYFNLGLSRPSHTPYPPAVPLLNL
ncbi:Uncharacterized protein NEOC65_000984 [Neochlamydia sp. AcF65]|uniref:hypothetical protein n=1 Tax=unclassified Neochlamydia TaxID=2643326 RepID=UPI00140CAB9D|nr:MULTISPECIES: hypothetical protein [unclassified Neochlamydia]MBS4165909.1 Uncharacterized protein [Neochlamydia sp. AcF65]NGY96097.1 hypothetical protein [Neochlamydia sp. AcF84]